VTLFRFVSTSTKGRAAKCVRPWSSSTRQTMISLPPLLPPVIEFLALTSLFSNGARPA